MIARRRPWLEVDPDDLRGSLLTLILRVTLGFGVIVYVPSVLLGANQGMVGLVVVDTLAVVVVAAMLFGVRLGFRTRALGVCVVYYALSIALLISVGAIGQIYLFGFSLLTLLLFGLRSGLCAVALSSLSLLVLGTLGYGAPEVDEEFTTVFIGWGVITLNFALVNLLLTAAVGVVLEAVSAALAATENERKALRTLVNTFPDAVFTKDTQGRFVHCNPAGLKLVGQQTEADVTGKTVFDLLDAESATRFNDDDQGVLAGHLVINREAWSRRPDGQGRWHLTNKVPMQDLKGEIVGLLAVVRDVTDQRQLLTELETQIDRMPMAYVLTDRDLRYRRWNPAAERMFGFTEAEAVGKTPFELILPSSADALATALAHIHAGTFSARLEAEHPTKHGGTVTCEWHNTSIFDEAGEFTGLLSLGEDISVRKRLEMQLRQAQKMEAIGLLAGGVAHDFNNMLSVVLSNAELALEELPALHPARESLEEIQQAGLRAADLTRQLLLFSRQQVVKAKVIDPNELLVGIDKMLRRLLGEDIEYVFLPDPTAGCIRADPGSIEQVIMNLVVNARDAMPGGGKLTLQTSNVEVDAAFVMAHHGATPGAYVLLSVTDSGVGMDPATLLRIFEPFYTTKERGKGTGLGLSTVYGIVEQCGGTVWVYSEVGVGTTFKVYLPRVDPAVIAPRAPSELASQFGSETILLVEDEPTVRTVARNILTRFGYVVLEARDGADAIAVANGHAGPIQLLLTDIVMPKMSGPALAKVLGAARPDLRILFMSGYTDDAAVRHGILDGGLAHLQKPLTVASLTQAVRKSLDGPDPGQAAAATSPSGPSP